MTPDRLQSLLAAYPGLRIAVIGDFCLDRYLDIDPALQETSIETGRPVHNVVRVRSQPGGAGTILSNLAALGIRTLPVGFLGEDGEGYELERALRALPGVSLDGLVRTPLRRTFTYAKPLVHEPGQPPLELDRLDSKNWTPTPPEVEKRLLECMGASLESAHAAILLEQTDQADTGVLTSAVLQALATWTRHHPDQVMVADSRRGLAHFPPVVFKMNAAELARMRHLESWPDGPAVREHAATLARSGGRPVVVTMAEQGMIGAEADGTTHHQPARPRRGEIDVVGAGDAVTAHLCACLAAGGRLAEALELASAAASVVLHKLGTTGTVSVAELATELTPTQTT